MSLLLQSCKIRCYPFFFVVSCQNVSLCSLFLVICQKCFFCQRQRIKNSCLRTIFIWITFDWVACLGIKFDKKVLKMLRCGLFETMSKKLCCIAAGQSDQSAYVLMVTWTREIELYSGHILATICICSLVEQIMRGKNAVSSHDDRQSHSWQVLFLLISKFEQTIITSRQFCSNLAISKSKQGMKSRSSFSSISLKRGWCSLWKW